MTPPLCFQPASRLATALGATRFLRRPLLLLALMLPSLSTLAEARLHGGMYTAEKLANVRANVERFDWARKQRDAAVKAAAPWLAKTDEELWRLIPGQQLPRCIDVTWDYAHDQEEHLGCLKCGDKIKLHGNYPYEPDFWNKPWKLTCPSCGVVFPTNDFGKYYESALDEQGLFDPTRGDRCLLFNAQHPDPADPLHKYGVDDGFGYIDVNKRAHKFIGYYTWKLWRHISNILSDLSEAYVLTGDKAYARKAAILLDRIADVYPSMDWKPYAQLGWYHSDGGTKQGKIEGSIWESANIARMADNYDKILSGTAQNPELEAFLKSRRDRFRLPGKGTREQFVENVDTNLLRCAAEAVKVGRIKGNFGMRQRTMALCAIALNQQPETEQWLDWIFSPSGGNLPEGILSGIDRDGMGNEAAPGYALSVWLGSLVPLTDALASYPQYRKHDVYRDYPNFARMLTAGARLAILDWTTPNIGDSGYTGGTGKLQATPDTLARPFKYLGDPASAVAAYRANGNSGIGILRDIFAADPDALGTKIAEVAQSTGDDNLTSGGRHLAGYGLASLEFGNGPDGKALWLYYGRNGGHGHLDRLNIGIYAFGHDLTPDLGYPEFAGTQPERKVWTGNTISHNTVVVDGKGQKVTWTGFPRFFKRLPNVGILEVESPNVYPQVVDYSRTIFFAAAQGGNAYAVDLFRVAGGSDHLLSFHGPPGPVRSEGLTLEAQTTGTYAGPEIPMRDDRPGHSPGYSWMNNVERARQVPKSYRLDWKAEAEYHGIQAGDDIHLRLHGLTPCTDLALADGEPPRNKPQNPRRLRYALLHRAGADLESLFASVIEPYQAKPFLKSATRVRTTPETTGAIALRIDHEDGTLDYVISNTTHSQPLEIEGGIRVVGSAAFVRMRDGKPVEGALVRGTELSASSLRLQCDAPEYTGRILRMDKDMHGDGELWVDTPLPEGTALAGEFLTIANDRERSACYEIRSVKRDGDLTRINCGPVSFVRGLADPKNPSKGFTYDFQEGSPFTLPRHATWKAGAP